MKKLMTFIEGTLLPAVNKFGSNKYIVALRDGIAAIIPFTIIGSIFMIITSFPVKAWTNFIEPYSAYLNIPNTVCMGLMAIIAVYSVAYNVAKQLGVKPVSAGFVSLVAFVITQTQLDGTISTANFGSTGLFLAIVIALISTKIIEIFEKKNITIKLPASVPTMVADSFSVLIPGFVVITLFWVLTSILGLDLKAILTLIFSPLVRGLDTLPGMLLVVFVSLALWCCGINESVISGLTYPVWYALLAENTAAWQAGETVTHIGAYGFQYFGFWMGGTGLTIALVLLMLRSKVKMYNQLGKLSIIPGIFEINEPVAFGFPIVFNPIMWIPYILAPLVTTTLYYFACSMGLIGMPVVAIPWTTPPVLNGFLVTGGDWRAAVFQLVMLVIGVIIYYPFFKYVEKKELAAQLSAEQNEAIQ